MGLGTFIISAIVCIAVVSGIVFTIRKAASAVRALPVTADWIDELSVERYRPMLHLLNPEDLRRLRAQAGYTPERLAQLRRQRCELFRGYLHCLRKDFARVCLALKLLMAQAENDRPDLASILIRNQAQFAFGILLVQIQLALYSRGLGAVNVDSVLGVFDNLRLELRALVPTSAALGAQ